MQKNFSKLLDQLKFTNLFDLKSRKKILINLVDLDGIGETQIKSLENFFSNKVNIRIIKDLIFKLKIENYIFYIIIKEYFQIKN